MLGWLVDLILHLDHHLVELLAHYDVWIYPILFAVIFAETGLVVTPFLPGDSLLFAVGALAAVDTSGTLRAPLASALLGIAAVLGNTVNYSIGHAIGPPAFSGRYRLLKVEYLERTEEFFRRHGSLAIALSRFVPVVRTCAPFVAGIGRAIGPPAFSGRHRWLKVEYLHYAEDFFRRYGALAITLSRFMPIVRTCAPFVAGIGRMPFGRFFAYNVLGGFLWVLLFVGGGYLFGNIPLVKENFGVVTLGVIGVSLLPLAVAWRRRRAGASA